MKKLFLIAVFALLCGFAMAQNSYKVSGVIKDEKGENLSFANIFVYKKADSSLFKAAAADIDGKFLVEDLTEDTFYLKISAVGQIDYITPAFKLSPENPQMTFPDFQLKENATSLDAVQVVAKKPFIEQKIDRTVLNVEGSISGSGSTALELLEKAPGVMVDRQNDQIKIRNKSGVIVMIDGKRNYMSSEALAQYLSNLPSDQIVSIEVITNPSSKYEAAGNAGIINIILKKNTNYGTNGTLTLGGGTGVLKNSSNDLYRGNTSLVLNHRNEKWNYFGSGSVGRSRWYNDNHFLRTATLSDVDNKLDQYTQRIGGGYFRNLKGGIDYYLSSKTTIGLQGDYNFWDGKQSSDGVTVMTSFDKLNSTTNSESSSNTYDKNHSLNLNLRNKDGDKEIGFDLEFIGYRNGSTQTTKNDYLNAFGEQTRLERQQIIQPTNINIFSSKLDFTIPFENKFKIEFGGKASLVKADNNFKFNIFEDNDWQIDVRRSNHFKYDEFISAAYFSSGYQIGKLSLQAGLRGENTVSDGYSVNLDQRNKRSYFNLFPTGYLNYKFSEKHALKYAYSKRVDRPNYSSLNPFVFILDPYLHVYGNPNLRPQFTSSNDLTYSFKDQYSLTAAYAYSSSLINEIIFNSDEPGVAISQLQNIATRQSYSLNLNAPIKFAKWWDSQNQFNLYYNKFEDGKIGGGFNRSKAVGSFSTTQTFTLPSNWTAELNVWYYGKGVHGLFEMTKPQYGVNPGVQKTFLDKKAKLKFSANDIFLTSLYNGRTTNGDFKMDINNRWNARRFMVTFTYNFGNQNLKTGVKKSASDDLKSRV